MTPITSSDRRILDLLIKYPERIDWLGVASAFEATAESGQFVDKALQLIPKNSNSHQMFSAAVLRCLSVAKRAPYYPWLVKALARILQPDANGNRVTPLLILSLGKQ